MKYFMQDGKDGKEQVNDESLPAGEQTQEEDEDEDDDYDDTDDVDDDDEEDDK